MTIRGIHVTDDLDLRGVVFPGSLFLEESVIDGDFNASNARFERGLSLDGSRVQGIVQLGDASLSGLLSIQSEPNCPAEASSVNLNNARIAGDIKFTLTANGITATNLRLQGQFLLDGATLGSESHPTNAALDLTRATIDGDVRIVGSRLDGSGLIAQWSRVTGRYEFTAEHWLVRNVSQCPKEQFLRQLDLYSSKADSLSITCSVIRGKADLSRITIDRDVLIYDHSSIGGSMEIASARIGGTLLIAEDDHSVGPFNIDGRLNASLVQVKGDVILRFTTFHEGVDFAGAFVLGLLDLSGASFSCSSAEHPCAMLTGANLGVLRLGSGSGKEGPRQHPSPLWASSAQLSLRNTHTKTFEDADGIDRRQSWPTKLDLVNFTYDQVGGLVPGSDELTMRDVNWFEEWLGRGTLTEQRPSAQPFRQAAALLRTVGRTEDADKLLYDARELERQADWRLGQCRSGFGLLPLHGLLLDPRGDASLCWHSVWLLSLKATTGYGFHYGRLIWWILALGVIGSLILRDLVPNTRFPWMWGLLATVDRLVPGLKLDKMFSDFFDAGDGRKLKGLRHLFFIAVAGIGFVLTGLVAAGLAGLTQIAQ